MKRFQWRLQRVLDIKQKQEQCMRAELMDINGKIDHVRRERIRQIRIIENLIRDISRERPNVRLNQQAFFMNCAMVNQEKIRQLENELVTLEHLQKEKTEELLALIQTNEGLERLRHQEEIAFIKDQEKREQKEMDDMTTGRFGLNMRRHREKKMVISGV